MSEKKIEDIKIEEKIINSQTKDKSKLTPDESKDNNKSVSENKSKVDKEKESEDKSEHSSEQDSSDYSSKSGSEDDDDNSKNEDGDSVIDKEHENTSLLKKNFGKKTRGSGSNAGTKNLSSLKVKNRHNNCIKFFCFQTVIHGNSMGKIKSWSNLCFNFFSNFIYGFCIFNT